MNRRGSALVPPRTFGQEFSLLNRKCRRLKVDSRLRAPGSQRLPQCGPQRSGWWVRFIASVALVASVRRRAHEADLRRAAPSGAWLAKSLLGLTLDVLTVYFAQPG
jgi:hypothetical protein